MKSDQNYKQLVKGVAANVKSYHGTESKKTGVPVLYVEQQFWHIASKRDENP